MSLDNDLKTAFVSESQAGMKYFSFAKRAEHEGLKKIAKLFRAAAEAELIHAHNHLRAMRLIKTSTDNIKVVLGEKADTSEQMYRPMIEHAKTEGDNWSTKSFCYAYEAGKVIARLFEKALKNTGEEKEADYFICRVCGFTVENEIPEKCPICGSQKKVFKKID
jgi:rubrerythrin